MTLRSGKRLVAEALFAPPEPSASRSAPGNFLGGIPPEVMADIPDVRHGDGTSSSDNPGASLRAKLRRVSPPDAAASAEVTGDAVIATEGAAAQKVERLPCTHSLTFTSPSLSTTGASSYDSIGPLQNPEKHARDKVSASSLKKYDTVLPRFARFCAEYNYDPADAAVFIDNDGSPRDARPKKRAHLRTASVGGGGGGGGGSRSAGNKMLADRKCPPVRQQHARRRRQQQITPRLRRKRSRLR